MAQVPLVQSDLVMPDFKLVSDYRATGDQPQAVQQLVEGVKQGLKHQTLLGVTGSGKTATMAWLVEAIQRPTLVMAPNKTLAAQLAAEFKEFFPDNAVGFRSGPRSNHRPQG